MVFLASGDLKMKNYYGPGLRSYHETYGNSLISIRKFAKKVQNSFYDLESYLEYSKIQK